MGIFLLQPCLNSQIGYLLKPCIDFILALLRDPQAYFFVTTDYQNIYRYTGTKTGGHVWQEDPEKFYQSSAAITGVHTSTDYFF